MGGGGGLLRTITYQRMDISDTALTQTLHRHESPQDLCVPLPVTCLGGGGDHVIKHCTIIYIWFIKTTYMSNGLKWIQFNELVLKMKEGIVSKCVFRLLNVCIPDPSVSCCCNTYKVKQTSLLLSKKGGVQSTSGSV